MKENVIEGNKLIRKFCEHDHLPYKFNYHEDWNDLMPVVEKIYLLREVKEVSIRPGRTRIWLQQSYIQSPCKPENNSITECWLAVTEFVQYYNTQKTNTP